MRIGPVFEEQFNRLSNAQLERTIPAVWRPFFLGKEVCYDGRFYIYDGLSYNFFTGTIEDDE